MKKLLAVGCLALAITGCGGGLTEKEKRAAEAHANNLCMVAKTEGMGDLAKSLAGLSDLGAVMGNKNDAQTRVVEEGTRLARERGCID